MLRFSLWEKEGFASRVYVNGLYPYRKGKVVPKFYFVADSNMEGALLKSKGNSSWDMDEAMGLLRKKLLGEEKIAFEAAFISWNDLLNFCGDTAENKKQRPVNDRVKGKGTKQAFKESLSKSAARSSDVKKQNQQVASTGFSPKEPTAKFKRTYELDLRDIEFPASFTVQGDYLEDPEVISLLSENSQVGFSVEALKIKRGLKVELETAVLWFKRVVFRDEPESIKAFLNELDFFYTEAELMSAGNDVIPVLLIEAEDYPVEFLDEIDDIASFLAGYNRLSVIHTYNKVHTCSMILKVVQKNMVSGAKIRRFVKPKPRDVCFSMLEAIPCVDREISARLLDVFGSFTGVVLATEAELVSVEGLGPKKALEVYGYLHGC